MIQFKKDNILLIERDRQKNILRVSFNGEIFIEEFENIFNKKLKTLEIIKYIELISFEINSVADLLFALKIAVKKENKNLKVEDINYSSTLNFSYIKK